MRKTARECAIKIIYEYLFLQKKNADTFQILVDENNLDEADVNYLSTIYDGVIENYSELNSMIEQSLVNAKLGRIYKCDLSILLVALYELKYMGDIPERVSVNEAVELAKIFSTDQSSSFINGVLSKFISKE